jgi:hypothetical protein
MSTAPETSDARLGRLAPRITAALVALVVITAAVGWWARSRTAPIELDASYYGGANYTVVVFGRLSCPACAASAEFHRAVVAAARARGVRIVAASTARDEDAARFAESIGAVPDEGRVAVPPPGNLTRIPTVLLVDRRGTVLDRLTGVPSAGDETRWLARLAQLPPA